MKRRNKVQRNTRYAKTFGKVTPIAMPNLPGGCKATPYLPHLSVPKRTLPITSNNPLRVVKGAGVANAVLAGGVEVVRSGKKYLDGDISAGEFAGNVAKESVGSGISFAAAGVAGTAVAGVSLLASAPAWVPAVIGLGVATAVSSGIKGLWDDFWD